MNSISTLADDRPDLFPGGGTGRRAHHRSRTSSASPRAWTYQSSVVIAVAGFEQLVDAIHEVNVTRPRAALCRLSPG